MTTTKTYLAWIQSYSGEDFDRAQNLAFELTDADRAAGRDAPPAGYSQANFDRATSIVRRANRYSAGHAGPVEY